MANENEMVEQNYAKTMAKVDELCHKVVEDPKHYAACVIDDGCTYILPVIKILAIAEDSHKREIAAKDLLINELAQALLSFLAILHNPCSVKQCREECSVKCREMSALIAKAREVVSGATQPTTSGCGNQESVPSPKFLLCDKNIGNSQC